MSDTVGHELFVFDIPTRSAMALTGTSTLADALSQYKDNLSWEGDVDKAALALEAVRFILIERPSRFSNTDRSFDYESLQAEKTRLEQFVAKLGSAASAARCSFVRARAL